MVCQEHAEQLGSGETATKIPQPGGGGVKNPFQPRPPRDLAEVALEANQRFLLQFRIVQGRIFSQNFQNGLLKKWRKGIE